MQSSYDLKSHKNHIHVKPIKLQRILIEAVTNKNALVLGPAQGGYSVLKSVNLANRNFLGGDILE